MGYALRFTCTYKIVTLDTVENKTIEITVELGGTYNRIIDVSRINPSLKKISGSFISLKFSKKIYEPGCFEFTLQKKDSLAYSIIGCVDLLYDGQVVANKYYIFDKVTKGEYITYKAYSADKFLTIERFNYAHTGKRLVDLLFKKDSNGVIVDENGNAAFDESGEKVSTPKALAGGIVFSLLDAPQKDSALAKFKELVLKNNKYYVKNLNHLGTGDDEAILPYCVQYQESFFDFMVRICNRYGEFLYCENNEWHIGRAGIKDEKGKEIIASLTDEDVQSEEKYESCIDIEETSNWEVSNYLNEVYVQNIMDRNKTNPVVNNAGMLSEEYFESIKNENYARYSDYLPPLSTAFDMLKAAEERQNFFDAVASTAVASALRFSIADTFMSSMNKNYNDYYGTLTDMEVDGKKHEFTRTSNKVDAAFYAKILKGEEYAEKNKLMLEFSTYRHLLLGQKVKYEGKGYVVYSVNGGITDNNTEYQTVILVPIQKEANSDLEKVYPLPLYDKHIKKASPQRAVVVFNFDPKRLGRVRVKYPWQTFGTAEEELEGLDDEKIEKKKKQNKLADATPWLRVSYPMASKGSGFMFFPKEKDEVLIDYEDGNIDRPFVAGSFYNEENSPSVPSSTHLVGLTKSITSDNGHHISFTDLSGDKFLGNSGLIPIASLLSKFGVEIPISNETDLVKYLGGGFEIADYLGVYSIKGSTHGRNITISSPVGDVVVDAFTGITIKAPHGDVNIVGKNVNIEARNNLTIQSGTNIKQPYFSTDFKSRDAWKKSIIRLVPALETGVLRTLGFDFSMYRTLLEVLFRPIGGTMLIKSYRFLRLEAGEGNTETALSGFMGIGETHNGVTDALETYVGNVKNVIGLLRNVILRTGTMKDPFARVELAPGQNVFETLKQIINGENIKEIEADAFALILWNIETKKREISNNFERIGSIVAGNNFEYLKGIVKKYEDYYDEVKEKLKEMTEENHDRISIEIEADYDLSNPTVCKKVLFNSISEYVNNCVNGNSLIDSKIKMDNSKIEDWSSKLSVIKGIEIKPTGKTVAKTLLLDPLLNVLSFDKTFLDENCWKKLDNGGIIYSVSNVKATKITKGDSGQTVSEEKTNKNVSLIGELRGKIAEYVSGYNVIG